ncbi:MAG: hypothetical protein NTV11_20445 [Rhodocyclales bacterium]|nr:hypothetical protein [Rhodocyclales bacterium]
MPRVPEYSSPQVQPQNLPGVQQSSNATPALLGVGGEQMQQFGKALAGFGGVMGKIASAELEEVDQARLQESYTKLSKAANASLYGDGGVMGLSGSQAVGAADKWSVDYDKIAGELSAELHPRQAQKFQKIVQVTKRAYHDNVMRHEFTQNKVFKDETAKAVIDQALENAGVNYEDGGLIGLNLGTARETLVKRPEYLGASAEVRQRMDAALEGSFHARVVTAALDAGNTGYAKEWFDANRDRIPLDMRGKVEKQLKPATDFAEGKALALEAQQKITAGSSLVEVESWMGEKAKSKEAHNVAQSMMAQHQDAQRRQDAKVQGGYLERFELAPSHKTFTAIMGDRGFQSMEPEARGKLVKYMRSELEQAGDKARARQNDKFRSPEAFDKFITTLESPTFGGMSRQEVYNLRPEIGPELTQKLLTEHKSAQGGAARFQIDKDLLNEAVPKELLQKQNKDKLNAYHGIVETELIKWKQENPSKLPTLDEQKKIARSANAEYVGVRWGPNQSLHAYDLKEGQSNAVPKNFYAKGEKRGLSEDQILSEWQQFQASRRK